MSTTSLHRRVVQRAIDLPHNNAASEPVRTNEHRRFPGVTLTLRCSRVPDVPSHTFWVPPILAEELPTGHKEFEDREKTGSVQNSTFRATGVSDNGFGRTPVPVAWSEETELAMPLPRLLGPGVSCLSGGTMLCDVFELCMCGASMCKLIGLSE